MSEKILIRLLDTTPYRYQWLQLGDSAQKAQSGELAALAITAIAREAVLLLPAAMVLLSEAELPIKNPAQIRQALPFVLEDRLADDLEQYHFTWVRQANQKLAVAAVAKPVLADCLAHLQQAGIEVTAVYPESLCLPYQPDQCSILIDGEQIIFRNGPWQGGGIDASAMPLLLDKWREQGLAFARLRVWGRSALQDCAEAQGVAYLEEASGEALTLFAGQLESIAALNLLTGPYLVSKAAVAQVRRYWPAAAMLVAALGLQLMSQLQLNWQLQAEAENLETQTQALFRHTFPDTKRIVNVRVQADQALQELQKQHSAGDSEFLRVLYAAGERLAAQPVLQLRSLAFAGDVLQLRVQANDAAELDSFVQALQNGWTVNRQSSQNTEQGLEVQIDIGSR